MASQGPVLTIDLLKFNSDGRYFDCLLESPEVPVVWLLLVVCLLSGTKIPISNACLINYGLTEVAGANKRIYGP